MLTEENLSIIDTAIAVLRECNCSWIAAQLALVLDKLEPVSAFLTIPGPDGYPNVELPLVDAERGTW